MRSRKMAVSRDGPRAWIPWVQQPFIYRDDYMVKKKSKRHLNFIKSTWLKLANNKNQITLNKLCKILKLKACKINWYNINAKHYKLIRR